MLTSSASGITIKNKVAKFQEKYKIGNVFLVLFISYVISKQEYAMSRSAYPKYVAERVILLY